MCTSSVSVRMVVWILLMTLVWAFFPEMSPAQQPTATIRSLSGNVLVNSQKQDTGRGLNIGDVIETQAGATVVLQLSDGSSVELREQTTLDVTELSQTADIETPNALIGVKFSQPDVEVSYDPVKQETVGIAHTVELMALNLVTNEKMTVPVGTTVVIVGGS